MMNKIKHHVIFVSLWFFILPFQLFAQSEREIITSGAYYWGQAVAENEETAKNTARDELIAVITNDLQEDIKALPNSEVLVNGIEYFSRPRGPRILAIAYVEKQNVEMFLKGEQLIITEIKYTENIKETEEAPKSGKSDASKEMPNENVLESSGITESKHKFKDEHSNDKSANDLSDYDERNIHMEKDTETITSVAEHLGSFDINSATESDFLSFIVQSDNISKITEVLNTARNRGIVQFGRYAASMLNPQGSYFIVFEPNSGNIVALLDKGPGNNRLNLKSNVIVQDFLETYKNMNIVWLQIY